MKLVFLEFVLIDNKHDDFQVGGLFPKNPNLNPSDQEYVRKS